MLVEAKRDDAMRCDDDDDDDEKGKSKFLYEKKESLQHRHFPCGPPPQYYTGCTQLNFTVRMGRGAFCVIWP